MSLAFAFAALALLRLGWLTPRAAGYVAAAALLLAMIAGLTLPDIDQPLPLDHRSAVTHSALPALLVTFRRWTWPVASGLAFGIGLHLAADLFPNAMIGFATVKAPFGGSIGADLSYAWLSANALGCVALGALLLRKVAGARLTGGLFAATAAVGAVYLAGVDGGWPALALLSAIVLLALTARYCAIRRPADEGTERQPARFSLALMRRPPA